MRLHPYATTMDIKTLDNVEITQEQLCAELGLPFPLPYFHVDDKEDQDSPAWKWVHEASLKTPYEWGLRNIDSSQGPFMMFYDRPSTLDVEKFPAAFTERWTIDQDFRCGLMVRDTGFVTMYWYRDAMYEYLRQDDLLNLWQVAARV